MTYNNASFSGANEICNAFAKFFQCSFDISNLPNYSHNFESRFNSFVSIQFDASEIVNGLDCLNSTGCVGPDGVAPVVLNKCAHSLWEPLLYLFNGSLSSGIFPEIWKKSFIVPIFKAGRRSDITCYRAISILSTIPKLFESLVKSRIEFHIKNKLSSRQHGFTQGKSTITNLMVFSSEVFDTVGSCGQVDVVYIDFSKAFDRLDHKILI